MTDLATLHALLDRCEKATRPDRGLDLALAQEFFPDVILTRQRDDDSGYDSYTHWEYTRYIDDAVALINRLLPGWWWKCGTCHVSDDACIAPDYSDPAHSERLHREFPLPAERYRDEDTGDLTYGPLDSGFDIDRRPPGNIPLALLESLLRALIEIETQKGKTDGR